MDKFFRELRRRNVVRVAGVYAVVGWVLVQIATTLEESMGLPAWFDGLIVALLIIGLPIALIFAWAFELTPEGVVRTEDIPEDQSITAKTGRKLDIAIIAGIVILGIVILMKGSDERGLDSTAEDAVADVAPKVAETVAIAPLGKSIAVLPFTNRSPNAEDAFFAAGVHDDLLTHLSKIADMHVISRTSVMGYADTDRKIPDIGKELGVATVMEGAVQRAGNRVRINVQLIDAATDAHLWAEIYDRELTADNIFDIQSEITMAIARALNTVLSDADEAELAKRPTQNLEAYDAFLAGKLVAHLYVSGAGPLLESLENFNRAIALDPEFGEAYAQRAYSEISLHWYTAEAGDWLGAAAESLRLADQFAPDAIETHMARGYYHYWGHLNYPAADREFDRALEKSPNYPVAIAGKAFAARRAGRFDEAITLLEIGVRLDPLNSDMQASLVESLAGLGRFKEANAVLQRVSDMEQQVELDPTTIALLWVGQGDARRAWDLVRPKPDTQSVVYYNLRAHHARLTRDPAAIRLSIDDWPQQYRSPAHAPETYNIARGEALRLLGDDDAANALFAEIKARIDARDEPYPSGWRANAHYFPVEVPGHAGDLEGVKNAVAEHDATKRPDAWAEIDYALHIARALANAGDPEASLDYLEHLIEIRGPYAYGRFNLEPDFDRLREHPRYLAMKAQFDVWAAEQT